MGIITVLQVSVFFMDYGNTEELPISSLAPLDDKFLVFPQQMLRCCFTAEKITINREVAPVISFSPHQKGHPYNMHDFHHLAIAPVTTCTLIPRRELTPVMSLTPHRAVPLQLV